MRRFITGLLLVALMLPLPLTVGAHTLPFGHSGCTPHSYVAVDQVLSGGFAYGHIHTVTASGPNWIDLRATHYYRTSYGAPWYYGGHNTYNHCVTF